MPTKVLRRRRRRGAGGGARPWRRPSRAPSAWTCCATPSRRPAATPPTAGSAHRLVPPTHPPPIRHLATDPRASLVVSCGVVCRAGRASRRGWSGGAGTGVPGAGRPWRRAGCGGVCPSSGWWTSSRPSAPTCPAAPLTSPAVPPPPPFHFSSFIFSCISLLLLAGAPAHWSSALAGGRADGRAGCGVWVCGVVQGA